MRNCEETRAYTSRMPRGSPHFARGRAQDDQASSPYRRGFSSLDGWGCWWARRSSACWIERGAAARFRGPCCPASGGWAGRANEIRSEIFPHTVRGKGERFAGCLRTQLTYSKEGEIHGSLVYFSERRISYAVAVLSILLAAVFLVGAIVNLYLIQHNLTRLGLIGVYTAGFAACVSILTNARRAELFASTAA